MIHVQSAGIEQSQKQVERTAPKIERIRQQRGTYAGNRSGIYN